MKKIFLTTLSIVLCLGILATVIVAQESYWAVFEPDYHVKVNGKTLNGKTEYPILEWEGLTYISVRDWGNLINADVQWKEENTIDLYTELHNRSIYGGEALFDDLESAEAIGKAVAAEKFSDKINEQTDFSIAEIGLSGGLTYYSIYVYFDGKESAENKEKLEEAIFDYCNADVEIRYFVKSGEINFLENRGNGNWEFVF